MVPVLDARLPTMEGYQCLVSQCLHMHKVWNTLCSHSFIYPSCVGPPSSVVDLTAQQQECGIFISWEPPYLLPGLSVSYKVYINGEMIQDDISSTNHTYYPTVTSSTVYSISVVAYNESVGDGPPVDTMARFNIGKSLIMYLLIFLSLSVAIDVCNIVTHKLSPGNWTYQFTISVSLFTVYIYIYTI